MVSQHFIAEANVISNVDQTTTMRVLYILKVMSIAFYIVDSDFQSLPEINDQFEEANHTELITNTTNNQQPEIDTIIIEDPKPDIITERGVDKIFQDAIVDDAQINDTALQIAASDIESKGYITKFYLSIKRPIIEFMAVPRVNIVLKNIGTCIVNGAMEIISYYFPAPLIPLIASAAGMMIPFEPVVMLRKRMPVTSYRRAFNSALNSFMGTFDTYKTSEEDPYMTRRFNKKFLADKSQENDN